MRKSEALAREVREIAENLDPRITEAAARFEIQVGEDWRGEPAVFVTIVLKDERAYYVWPDVDDYERRLRARLRDIVPEEYFTFISTTAESVALDPEKAPA